MLHARAWTILLTPSMFRQSIKPIICLERWAWRDELSWESLWWHEIDSRSSRLRIECTCLHEQLYILHNDECIVATRIFHTPTNPPRSPGSLYCFVLLLGGRRRRQWRGLDDIRELRWRELDKIWESRFWWGEGVSVVAGRCKDNVELHRISGMLFWFNLGFCIGWQLGEWKRELSVVYQENRYKLSLSVWQELARICAQSPSAGLLTSGSPLCPQDCFFSVSTVFFSLEFPLNFFFFLELYHVSFSYPLSSQVSSTSLLSLFLSSCLFSCYG